jgi:hypothetical protein
MIIYIGLIFILILGSFALKRKSYFLFSVLLLTFFAGLRHPSMGLGDIENVYYPQYLQSKTMGVGDILSSISSGTGYLLLMKIFTLTGLPFQFFLFFNSAIFVLAAERLMYKYSKDYLLSQIIFISSAYIFSFALIRQYMAVAILMFAFPYLIERKPIKYCVLVLLAALFHYTVLIVLVLYPLVRFFKSGKIDVVILIIGIVFGILFPSIVLELVKILFPQLYVYYNSGIYSKGEGISWGWFLILMMPVLFYFIWYLIRKSGNIHSVGEVASIEKDLLLVNCIGIALFCFSSIIVEFYRASQYFTISYMILLANLICMVRDKGFRNLAKIVLSCLFVVYMFRTTLQILFCSTYKFFWM